jgi:hypothetical protein
MSDDRSHSAGSAPKPPDVSRDQKVALAMIGVTAVARFVRNRRTYERVILLAIVLAALAGMARASQDRSTERLMAWFNRKLAEVHREEASRS